MAYQNGGLRDLLRDDGGGFLPVIGRVILNRQHLPHYNLTCPICEASFQPFELVRDLDGCRHWMHAEPCFSEYRLTKKFMDEPLQCPICMKPWDKVPLKHVYIDVPMSDPKPPTPPPANPTRCGRCGELIKKGMWRLTSMECCHSFHTVCVRKMKTEVMSCGDCGDIIRIPALVLNLGENVAEIAAYLDQPPPNPA